MPQAVEKTLTLQELSGPQTIGSYFALTDRNPGPGEFKYTKQGSFLTGELLSDPNSAEMKSLLRMLAEATYVKPNKL